MVANFSAGGAAINQLARAGGAKLRVIPLSLGEPTADFTKQPALTEEEFLAAVAAGYDAVPPDCDLVCLGEMGIGNTTAAAALAAALFGGGGARWAGRGTGVDEDGLARKRAVIDRALAPSCRGALRSARHCCCVRRPRTRRHSRRVSGGAAAAHSGPARRLRLHRRGRAAREAARTRWRTRCRPCSAEAATGCCSRNRSWPLLDLDMRLGEASGAAVALLILRAALACHTGMATFAEAGVSDKPAERRPAQSGGLRASDRR